MQSISSTTMSLQAVVRHPSRLSTTPGRSVGYNPRSIYRLSPSCIQRNDVFKRYATNQNSSAQHTTEETESNSATSNRWSLLPNAAWAYLLLAEGAFAADDGLSYNPTGGEEFIKNLAGGAYIFLVAVFLYRVLTRRAKRAREQVCGTGSQHSKSL